MAIAHRNPAGSRIERGTRKCGQRKAGPAPFRMTSDSEPIGQNTLYGKEIGGWISCIKTIPRLNVAEHSITESELLNGIQNMQAYQPRHPHDEKANTTAIQQNRIMVQT